jgi:hypothetical protein
VESKDPRVEVQGSVKRAEGLKGQEGWEITKADDHALNSWYQLAGPSFQVRLPDYKKKGLKGPSESPIYDVVMVDAYTSKQKIKNVGRKVRLNEALLKSRTGLGLPACFIVNWMIPEYAPANPVWGKAQDDGEGQSLVYYMVLSDRTVEDLKKPPEEWPPALKLVKRFVDGTDEGDAKTASPPRQRFKVITRVCNLTQVDFNSATRKLLTQYNEKPFLTRTTISLDSQPDCFEVNIDVHNFGYLSRMGLSGVKGTLRNVVFDVGFVVQGDDDFELPERLLGCARTAHLQLSNALPAPPQFYESTR